MQNLFNSSVKNSDIKVTEIYQTYDYDKFKIMDDNRNVNLLHIKRLVESFNEKQLICPIIVNEKFQVIDGQHRLTASKESEMPVYYYIAYGYGINEVQKLNTNQKNWVKTDYLDMYCAEGRKPYLLFKKFMDDFPSIGVSASEKLLTGIQYKSEQIADKTVRSRYFEEGRLEIPNITKSYNLARSILDYKPYYKKYHNPKFVSAIIGIYTSGLVTHVDLLKKVKKCASLGIPITDAPTTIAYRDNLEELYNYRRSEKVSFRYL